jgi:hypothetical protein
MELSSAFSPNVRAALMRRKTVEDRHRREMPVTGT